MKKIYRIILLILVVVIVFFATFLIVNIPPSSTLSNKVQVQQILVKSKCAMCHSQDPKLPFYVKYAKENSLFNKHIIWGYKSFDIVSFVSSIKGDSVNQVDLEKMKYVVDNNTMPPCSFMLVHWKSYISNKEKKMISDWIVDYRIKHINNGLAAPEFANEPIQPIPDSVMYNVEKAKLGEQLFIDSALSVNNTLSCASCHGLKTGGVDNQQYSDGVNNNVGTSNAPTVYNSSFNFVQFWDGRASTLAQQAEKPVLNPIEMGSKSFDDVILKLKKNQKFTSEFCKQYPEGYSMLNITDAIAEYEKSLITPNSRFDKYLKGDKCAISKEELYGYELFKKYNCATCHSGVIVGGLSYEPVSVANDYFITRKISMNEDDKGRYKQTLQKRDLYRYKVPGLRNVEVTYPYFHDGTQNTLQDAVKMMLYTENGIDNVSYKDINAICDFLKTLTGQYNGKTLCNPQPVQK